VLGEGVNETEFGSLEGSQAVPLVLLVKARRSDALGRSDTSRRLISIS
jgi:hypothetical protein